MARTVLFAQLTRAVEDLLGRLTNVSENRMKT